MRIKSFIAGVVIVAFASSILAPAAGAAENPGGASTSTPHVDFQQAIAHAAAQAAATPQIGVATAEHVNKMQGYPGGGGGGHMMMIMSLVGMVAGLGMTYYVIKATQKATKSAQQGQ